MGHLLRRVTGGTEAPIEPGLRGKRGRRALLFSAVLLAAAAVSPTATFAGAASPEPYAAVAHGGDASGAGRGVLANLWEWNWRSVARECVTVLGPEGYGGVQVAPPQDSLKRTELGNGSDTVLHPWWEVYQPVDYGLTSRMGTEAEFKAMVATCRGAGVKVYVDAVINHMTGQGHVSYGGVEYTKYEYAGLYGNANFHHPGSGCPTTGGIDDFNDYTQVFKCELVGLSDLRTETGYVRGRLAAYLNKLLGYGVSGFRVDAAKHIGQADLAAIQARLRNTVDGTRPYFALEVFPGGPGRLSQFAFLRVGSVLGLDADVQLKNAFKSYSSPPNDGNIGDLKVFGEEAGLPPGNKVLAFVQNHDTERNGDALNYKDGATNVIANEFLLAYGYGTPQVYASFAWNTPDDSPPADANGLITDTDCANGWVCVDRYTGVANMVGFHNYVGDAPVANWYDDGVNLIAFSRGQKGWITINNETTAQTHTFATGLRRGTYCDIIHGDYRNGSCTGPTVTVDRAGRATVTVPAKDAVAFDARNLVRG
jgi:alpha-amylase